MNREIYTEMLNVVLGRFPPSEETELVSAALHRTTTVLSGSCR